MIRVRVQVDLRPLKRFTRLAQANSNHPAVDQFFNRAATRYLGFARDRFDRYSKGGGNWPPLKSSTISARRAGKGKGTLGGQRQRAMKRLRGARTAKGATRAVRTLKRVGSARGKVAILRDTGTLFNALAAGAPGNHIKRTRRGVEVGIGGNAQHPEGKMTIGRLAAIHNEGLGHVPKREITPAKVDGKTEAGIERDVVAMVRRLGRSV